MAGHEGAGTTAETDPKDGASSTHRHSNLASDRVAHATEFTIWRRPKLLQCWKTGQGEDEERKSSWSELFGDLIYVSAISKLSDVFRDEYDLDLLKWLVVYYWLFMSWSYSLFYSTKLHAEDVPHIIMHAALMACVMCQGTVMEFAFDGGRHSILYGVFVNAPIVIVYLFYIRAAIYIPYLRRFTFFLIVAHPFVCLFYLLGFYISDLVVVHIIVIVLHYFFCRLYVVFVPQRYIQAPPIDIPHCVERIGCFTMVVLGESAFSVTQTIMNVGPFFYPTALGTLVMMILFKMLYFDVDTSDTDHHALRRSRFWGFTWMWANIVFTGCMALGGALNEMVVVASMNDDGPVDLKVQRMLSGNMAMALLSLGWMQLSHLPPGGVEGRARRSIGIALRAGLAFVLVVIAIFAPPMRPLVFVIMSVFLTAPMVAVDLFIRYYLSRKIASKKANSRWSKLMDHHTGGKETSSPKAGISFVSLVESAKKDSMKQLPPADSHK